MEKYKNYLATSKLAKITLVLLVAEVLASVYVTTQITKYMGTSAMVIGIVISAVIGGLIWICHYKAPKASVVLEVILAILLIAGVFATGKLNSIIGMISKTTEYETVQIVALKDSGIKDSDDFASLTLGYANDDSGAYDKSSEILEENGKKVEKSKPYKNTKLLYNDLKSSKTQLMVLTSNTRSDLTVIDEDYEDKIIVLFEKKYEIEQAKLKPVNMGKDPFTVYLCGADLSSGENINSTGRGDVNILLTVNPKTKQINMQAIPRDTFVHIPARGGSSKLSYSGWWGGIQSSIQSIEKKFDVEINYYAKINFNGLIDLVDALGGVTVYSHYTYSAGGYNFVEGSNEVNGEQALLFARARKMLPQNELSRGQHQMELIKGIFKKFAENPTYDSGMAVLNSLSNNFVTNIPEDDYYQVFKLVAKLLPELENMENQSLEGEYKWHYDEIREGYYQYYYYPTASEIQRVRNTIQAVLDGKTL